MMEAGLKKIAAICAGFMLFVIGLSVLFETEPESTVFAGNNTDQGSIQNIEEHTNGQNTEDVWNELYTQDVQDAYAEPVVQQDDVWQADVPVASYMLMSQGVALVDSERWKAIRGEFVGDIQIILPAVPAEAVVTYADDYVARTLDIKIDNSVYELQDINFIQRIANGKYYIGKHDALLSEDPVRKINLNRYESNTYAGRFCTDIRLKLNSVYSYEIHTFDDVMCIDVINPRKIYDNVIVLDAGHGGEDTGSCSTNGRYYEKNIALNIIKRLKKKLDKTNIKAYYTRLDDTGLALHQRVDLANALAADMFISVHCNSYKYYWLPGVNGAEALYSSVCKEQKDKSRKLARTILNNVTKATGIKKREVVNRKRDLHILRESTVPTTIIEVGYISDSNDISRLIGADNVKKVADGIYKGIIKYYKNTYGKEIQ